MSGVNKIILSNLTPQKKKGSVLRSALGSAFSSSKIASTNVSTLKK